MSRALIKKIEFSRIKDFACNIKVMLRSASQTASVQQRAMALEQNSENKGNSINSTYDISNIYRDQQQQHYPSRSIIDGNNTKTSTTLRTTTKYADKNSATYSANSANSIDLGNEIGRRHSFHSKLNQQDFMPTNSLNENQRASAGLSKEGPCKRTLSIKSQEIKIVPSIKLKSVVDNGLKSKHLNSEETVTIGRRDRHRHTFYSNDAQLGLHQSLEQHPVNKKKSTTRTNIIHRANQIPRKFKNQPARAIFYDQNFPNKTLKIISGRRESKNFEQMQREIKTAKYGQTLTKIAEKNLIGLRTTTTPPPAKCHLSPENTLRFSIKNHLHFTPATLKEKEAEKERKIRERDDAIKQQEALPKTLKPTIRFGRRATERKAQDLIQLKETKILSKSTNNNDDENDTRRTKSEPNIYQHIFRDEIEKYEQPARRFDEIFYREGTKDEKSYTQTWADFPPISPQPVETHVNVDPPPFVKRPKNERPTTAKPWEDE